MGITSLKDQGEKMKNQTIPTDGDLDSLYKRNGVMNINPELEGIEKYKKLSMIIDGKESETFKNSRPVNEKSKQFMESYINYCKNFEILKNKGLGIAMSGNAGTGKTYYSSCIENELNNKYKVYRMSLSHYLQQMREDFNELYYLKLVKESDLVIIEDFGNEYLTEWGKEKVVNLLFEIYNNRISLIFSTNLDFKTQLKNFLDVKGSDKLLDRIKERCKPYNFDWKSQRAEIYKEDFERYY